ncbi:MAG: metal ABC transporter ATP-binding protein [Clostridia bacterium]|nr:metal ABC transporter ATP-binding protein [Clostridia bacterium]
MGDKKICGLHCTKINNISVKVGKQEILKNINIHIHCGELTVLIGQNGAGKTTLLKAILGEIPHKGKVVFLDMKENKKKNIRIGYVPQSINIEKHMPTTVYDMVASFITQKPVCFKKDKKVYTRIEKQLQLFGAESLIEKSIGDLSGGELQRVLLAVATTPIPNLLILDEPVSGIDKNGIEDFFETVNRIKSEYDMSIILVSHNLELVKKYADKVILLDKQIVKEGSVEEVYSSKEFRTRFGEV